MEAEPTGQSEIIVPASQKDKFSYAKNLLYNNTGRVRTSINKNSKISSDDKLELQAKLQEIVKDYHASLRDSKDSDKDLDNLIRKFKGLSAKVWGYNKNSGIIFGDKKADKKVSSITDKITRAKARSIVVINKSRLENSIKDLLIAKINLITDNLKKEILKVEINQLDSLDKLITDILSKTRKNCVSITGNITSKHIHQFNQNSYLYPENEKSFWILHLYKDIRKDLITPFANKIRHRLLYGEGAVYDRDSINLSSDLYLVKEKMYSSSNFKEVCLNILKGLIEINLRYYYPNCRDSPAVNTRWIYTTLISILQRAIRNTS